MKSASGSPSNIDRAGRSRRRADLVFTARRRVQLLRDLNEQVKVLGLDLGAGGKVPPQTLS
ncbi:hypothetical protein EAS61_07085 [Bradyrhizobium zhanjiangense]|uniref:Uncharacterized protein n=1 Tax=Bradyrhizobium zhanjiangense TaxID=1325107 RepID=A0A4Q0QWA6_9BRAD|nr:hypothetical protein EAS61_07085 [Bradyrhizobium zhanjiangense]